MSAFIVDEEHIHVLVWAGLHFADYGPLRWSVPTTNPTQYHALEYDDTDAVGAMLWHENHVSVNYRYREQTDEPGYRYRAPRHQSWSPVEVLKAIRCLDYQSCEHPGWATSEARAYLDALQDALVHRLPGMDAAPWEIDPTTVPAALAVHA